jgi:hypothetical protein
MSPQLDRKKSRCRISLAWIETLESRSLLSGSTVYVTTSADSGAGSLRQAIVDADALHGQQPVDIVFNLPTTDQGYNPGTGAWTFEVDSSLPTLTATGVTIDSSEGLFNVPAGISIQGTATSSDVLSLIGDGQDGGAVQPDPSTTGSGSASIGGLTFGFAGINTLAVSNLATMTLETPNAGNVLTVTSPATGQNQVGGSSGGVPIVPLSFSSVGSFTIDTAINDNSTAPDTITIDSNGLVATGLANFTIETGSTNANVTVLASSLALPVSGGTFLDEAGAGSVNTLVAQADVNYSVSANSLSIPGSGSISLVNVQNLQLTGGADSTAFTVNGWLGNIGLDGGPGSAQLVFNEPGSYGGNLSLTNFSSTTIQIQGNFLGSISAPQSSTIQQILIYGTDEAGSSITAGAFVSTNDATSPAVHVFGDFGGSITASENLSIAGSGVLSSIEIDGNLLASTSMIWTGAIGTLTIGQNLAGQVVAEGAGTIGTIKVGGNLTGTVTVPEDPSPGSGKIGTITVGGSLTGTVSSGNISGIVVGADLLGVIIAEGAGTIGTITVGGNLGGTVKAPEDPNPGSGNITTITVGGSLTGTVSSGNISGIVVGADLLGVIIAEGAGTIGSITVGGNLGGSVSAPEDPNPGSGKIGTITVGGSLTGTVSSGNISGIVVGADLLGVIIAEGAGTIGTITVGGNLGGTVTAPEDPNPGSGQIGTITVGGSLTGTVSSGNISGIVVGADLLGVIIAEGAGTIGSVVVHGNLGGQVIAAEDNISANSGEIGSIIVNGMLTGLIQAERQLGQGSVTWVGASGSIEVGDIINGLSINESWGTISAGNVSSFVGQQIVGGSVAFQSVYNFSIQSLAGAFHYQTSTQAGLISIGAVTPSGVLTGGSTQGSVSIGTLGGKVNLGTAGSVSYSTIAAGSEIDASSIVNLTILQDLGGIVNVAGDLQQLNIVGSMVAGSEVLAGSLESATIGQNMAGLIQVTGTLGSLVVGGATPGSVIAGKVGSISAAAGTGPIVLQVRENGIERQLQAISTASPFQSSSKAAAGTLAQTTFRYFYESGSLPNPQLTVQVNNHSTSTVPNQYDLSLVVDSGSAKFNLARVDASGLTEIGNVTVEGDILTAVSCQAAAFFPGDTTRAGVQLPSDRLAGVEVRDFIPFGGYIGASSIQAISAGLIGLSWGQTISGASASAYSVQSLLSSSTKIVQASSTFRVPFAGSSTYQVGFFVAEDGSGQFNWANVALTIQNEVSYDSVTNANIVTPMNVARGADIALIQVGTTGFGGNSQIQGISLKGDGASLTTYQWINGSISSTGALGDVTLLNWQPVGDISASSIFGTITSYAQYNGTIETTGLRTDPITGVVSASSATFGRVYLNSSNQLTTTTFETYSGAFSGQLIVRGNLVSNVILNGGLTGAIDAQGSIGTKVSGLRLGGITSNGDDTGSILALGKIFGNLTINGTLGNAGSIVSEDGIIGSLTITGNLGANAKIVSGGVIGRSVDGTELTIYGNIQGLIVSAGILNEWSGDSSTPTTFADVKDQPSLAPSLAAIDQLFAGSATGLIPITEFDSSPDSLDLENLDDLMTMIAQLHIDKNGQLSVIPGA